MSLLCFYSILVRLKVRRAEAIKSVFEGFYSILVRLKGYADFLSENSVACFYSILVRLKVNDLSFGDLDLNVSIPYWFD